ncbi:MAG: hypothetical protein ABL971_16990 [Vicinamibacterales bacterium]
MRMKTLVTLLMATCAAVVTSAALVLAAQAAPQKASAAVTAHAMPAKCKAMMAEHEEVMAGMKAADSRQDALVVKMNKASGKDKAKATAALVTDMVASRRGMQDGMMTMQHKMMGHMAEHMQAGKESMESCPMMKPMGDMKH